MSKKQPATEQHHKEQAAGNLQLGRRGFLHTGLLGAAAASAALAGPQRSTAEAAAGLRQRGATPIVDLEQPVDPQAVSVETWNDPWVWRPSDWPREQLHLNVVESQNPGVGTIPGNPNPRLFSYGGITPGPTIRMRGDETLAVKLRNLLEKDFGVTFVHEYPDPNELTPDLTLEEVNSKAAEQGNRRDDFCLGEHTNGLHAAHVTNLHTHGLHVSPGENSDGTHSDNIILRVLNQPDYRRRKQESLSPSCVFLRNPEQIYFLTDDEVAGEANYEFRIGNVLGVPGAPHPPGTHWYHPHAHGSTHNQVASGMAGFLIIEGDVDDRINQRMTGSEHPEPTVKSGPFDYRERLMLMQRVSVPSTDPDASRKQEQLRQPPAVLVNGSQQPARILMRPGAVERWRVLNGSVDGKGYRRFMVLNGQYGQAKSGALTKYDPETKEWHDASLSEVERDKLTLYQLAMDGVTLVTGEGDDARYTIKDLALQNPSPNPLATHPIPEEGDRNLPMLENLQAAYRDPTSVRNTYLRPNEVYLAPANRTDVFFKVPVGTAQDTVLTVIGKSVIVHADNPQQMMQQNVASGTDELPMGPGEVIVAYIVVKETGIQEDFDVLSLRDVLPPVPPYLRPLKREQLIDGNGKFRTRTITYSGWGSQDFPLVSTDPSDPSAADFKAFIEQDQAAGGKLEKLRYARNGTDPQGNPIFVLLPPAIRSMAINGRKFDPTDPERPVMLLDSAEEWLLENSSMMLWGDTGSKPPGQWLGHFRGYPISRKDGQDRFFGEGPYAEPDYNFQIVTKGVDHPFHIHQNPCWVLSIEVPDENGNLVNILDEPRWQDVIFIPRNQGRVVFRTLFADYVGTYVNHCHILLHEDNGMMQAIEASPFEDHANYAPKDKLPSDPGSQTDFPRPTPEQAYVQNTRFVDPNRATGQVYPGFVTVAPKYSGS